MYFAFLLFLSFCLQEAKGYLDHDNFRQNPYTRRSSSVLRHRGVASDSIKRGILQRRFYEDFDFPLLEARAGAITNTNSLICDFCYDFVEEKQAHQHDCIEGRVFRDSTPSLPSAGTPNPANMGTRYRSPSYMATSPLPQPPGAPGPSGPGYMSPYGDTPNLPPSTPYHDAQSLSPTTPYDHAQSLPPLSPGATSPAHFQQQSVHSQPGTSNPMGNAPQPPVPGMTRSAAGARMISLDECGLCKNVAFSGSVPPRCARCARETKPLRSRRRQGPAPPSDTDLGLGFNDRTCLKCHQYVALNKHKSHTKQHREEMSQ